MFSLLLYQFYVYSRLNAGDDNRHRHSAIKGRSGGFYFVILGLFVAVSIVDVLPDEIAQNDSTSRT